MGQRMAWALLAVTVTMLATPRTQAQAIRPVPAVEAAADSGLTVHGHAEMKVRPDIAYVSVGVVTQARDSTQAVADNAARATALMAALKKAGLADKDIQTQSYGVEPQYDYNASPAVLTGYQVTNTVQVTVRDLARVGQVIDAATQAGGNQINGVTFDLADRTQAEAQVLAQAVVEARVKASVMAQAAGVSLGRLMQLTEGSEPVVQPLVMERPMLMKAAAEPSTPVSAQDISVTADVTALYGLGL